VKKKIKDKIYRWFSLSIFIVLIIGIGILGIDIIHKQKTIENQKNEMNTLKLIISTK